MARKNPLDVNYKRNKRSGKSYFVSGAPQATFTKRDGSKFTRTYTTKRHRQKAVKAWIANGGRRPKMSTLRK
ncbi:MAG: hypothetical protein Wins2KO_04160 [Winogradskyella sp.]